MTLEELLKTKFIVKNKDEIDVEISPDFIVSVQKIDTGGVHFIIHPDEFSGETLDFVCHGNNLTQFS